MSQPSTQLIVSRHSWPDKVHISDDDEIQLHVVNRLTPQATIRVLINGRVHPRLCSFTKLIDAVETVFGFNSTVKVELSKDSWFVCVAGKISYQESQYHHPSIAIPDEFMTFVDIPMNNFMVHCKRAQFEAYESLNPFGDEELLARLRTVLHDFQCLTNSPSQTHIVKTLEQLSNGVQNLQMGHHFDFVPVSDLF